MDDATGKYLQLYAFDDFIGGGGGGYPLQKGESMRARLCSHTKSDGTPCRAVALAGRTLCFAHHRQLRRQQARRPPAIRLGPLADQQSIQRALNRVFQATVSGSLPPERAAGLLDRIQFAIGKRQATALRAPATPPDRAIQRPAFALTPARLYNQPNPAQKDIPRSRQPERKI